MNIPSTEQQLIEAIRADSQARGGQVMGAFIKTFAIPTIVFIVLVIVGNSIREYVAINFNNNTALNLSTFASTVLATLALSWWALRWADRQFGGWTLLRGLFNVTRLTLGVERAQESGDMATASRLADETWETYRASMGAAGIDVPELR